MLGFYQGYPYSPSTMFMWPLCIWQVTTAWEYTPLSLRTLCLVSVCVRECLCLSLLLITSLRDTIYMMRLYNSMSYCACCRGYFNALVNAMKNTFPWTSICVYVYTYKLWRNSLYAPFKTMTDLFNQTTWNPTPLLMKAQEIITEKKDGKSYYNNSMNRNVTRNR
jgi:hypothetical protein